ncbi:MAG: helix-turn-helix transcriptional regulator [Kiritimatiellae bacterium]|nr:helix-turn-helix transcriptional regulator [Kiritimatiellia bacterium]
MKYSLLGRIPAIRETGIGLAYFPDYQNRAQRMHGVDVILFSCILRGEGTHYLGETTYRERPGAVGITHYGQEHDIVTDPGGMDIMNVYVDLESLGLPVLPVPLMPLLPRLLPLHPGFSRGTGFMTHVVFPDPAALERLVMLMYQEFTNRCEGHTEILRDLFRVFLSCCARYAEADGFSATSCRRVAGDAVVTRILAELHESDYGPVDVQALARRHGISRGHLCRTFKQFTGKSISKHVLEQRIQRAMLLLRTSERKVLEIAYESGFTDVSFFNREFKKRLGMPPLAYRKAAGG